jgi:hypothetical protein
MQQGQRQNLEGEMLNDMKAATTFEELTLLKPGLTLSRLNQRERCLCCEKNGKTTLYYDVASGLKVAESKVMEKGKSMTQTTNYGDYREVKGVKVPFNIIQMF